MNNIANKSRNLSIISKTIYRCVIEMLKIRKDGPYMEMNGVKQHFHWKIKRKKVQRSPQTE